MTIYATNVWPKRVVFGVGALDGLAKELRRWSGSRAILITDPKMGASDGAARVKASASEAGISLGVFDQVEENPSDTTAHAAAKAVLDAEAQLILGLGGGSALDCAKAANIIASNGGQIGDYDLTSPKKSRVERALPWVSIPTTAGTGSEVCPVTVVTDSRRHVKYSVSSPRLIAEVCVADPLLTVSMPPALTAWTGADALTHAIEAYFSRIGFPAGNAMALESIRLLGRYLPAAVQDGSNLEAREQVLLGSMLAGMAFAQNALGLTHAMAHQLTTERGIQHGLANGIVLPVVMEFNARSVPEKCANIAQALGASVAGLGEAAAAERGAEAVRGLLGAIGIPTRVEGGKVAQAELERLVSQAMEDTLLGFNPARATAEDVLALYRQVLP